MITRFLQGGAGREDKRGGVRLVAEDEEGEVVDGYDRIR